jgi:hypothetical protein
MAGGEALKGPGTENADTGGPPEQRGRIESDGQPVGDGGRWSLRRHDVSLAHPLAMLVTWAERGRGERRSG